MQQTTLQALLQPPKIAEFNPPRRILMGPGPSDV